MRLRSQCLWKRSPLQSAIRIAVTVKPGKYGPIGKRIAPIKSPRPATKTASNVPSFLAAIKIGTKENPIFKFHKEMDKKRASTTCIAIKIATITMSLSSR